jgi:hypothetical protein
MDPQLFAAAAALSRFISQSELRCDRSPWLTVANTLTLFCCLHCGPRSIRRSSTPWSPVWDMRMPGSGGCCHGISPVDVTIPGLWLVALDVGRDWGHVCAISVHSAAVFPSIDRSSPSMITQ